MWLMESLYRVNNVAVSMKCRPMSSFYRPTCSGAIVSVVNTMSAVKAGIGPTHPCYTLTDKMTYVKYIGC